MFNPREILKKAKKGISIDTRTIKKGQLFIPIKGPNFDGYDFIPEAVRKGAKVLKVKDGLKALQKLATYHRSKFKIPVIGITGSVGKTTTKDMLSSILAEKYPVLKNKENYNNEIGVPLALLQLTKKHKVAVIEMAMQKRGEIAELVKIVRPTIAVITNIGEAHLKFLESLKNVAKAKAEILKGVKYAVLPAGDEFFNFLRDKAKGIKIIPFFRAENITLPLPGEYNLYNAGAAIAAAEILGIKDGSIRKGLEQFRPSRLRMEIINRPDGVKILNDSYNANPTSMRAALKELRAQSIEHRQRTIAVLGDMLELGAKAKSAHKEIIKYAEKLGIDKILTFGNLWPQNIKNKQQLIKRLQKIIRPGDIILIKGSRGMRMEEVVGKI